MQMFHILSIYNGNTSHDTLSTCIFLAAATSMTFCLNPLPLQMQRVELMTNDVNTEEEMTRYWISSHYDDDRPTWINPLTYLFMMSLLLRENYLIPAAMETRQC